MQSLMLMQTKEQKWERPGNKATIFSLVIFSRLPEQSMLQTVFSLGLFGVVRTTWFVWCATWLVQGNPFAPLGLNSNNEIHGATSN